MLKHSQIHNLSLEIIYPSIYLVIYIMFSEYIKQAQKKILYFLQLISYKLWV